jgi:hypothetical protein
MASEEKLKSIQTVVEEARAAFDADSHNHSPRDSHDHSLSIVVIDPPTHASFGILHRQRTCRPDAFRFDGFVPALDFPI